MNFFQELKRRNVFRVTATYVVIGWLLLQIGDVVFEALELSASANRMLMAFVLLGLIPTILFAWAFEITPDGIKRDKDARKDQEQLENQHNTAKKLDYVTMGVLVVVGCMSLWQHWSDDPETTSKTEEQVQKPSVNNTIESTKIEIEDKSLAVIPFTNLANTDNNEPFTVGIHDDLITTLSKISALKVISRTSVLKYNSTDMPIKEIANKLHVAYIVEGSVQRVGNQVRLNIKLVDALSGKHLWAEGYNRELTTSNIFNIQSEISQEVANALRAQLTDAEVQSITKQQTDNLDAYNAYLAGRQRLLNRNTESLYEALDLFTKAINLDSNYALAYVGKADTLSLLNSYSDLSLEQMVTKGEPLLKKALSLDPNSVEAHTSQANYLAEQEQLTEAKNGFQHALTLNPNYATTYHWYGNVLSKEGDKDKALAMYEKAAELDPISPVIQSNIASILAETGRHQEALAHYDRIIELMPEYPGSSSGKASVYAYMGELDEAIKWQLVSVQKDPGNIGRKVELAKLYLDIGLVELTQKTIKDIQKQSPDYHNIIHVQGSRDMYMGQYNDAVQRYSEALKSHPDNTSYQQNLAFYQMLAGQYQQAIDGFLKLYAGPYEDSFEIRNDNFESSIYIIWLWQKTGELSKAEKTLDELKQYLVEYSHQNNQYKQAMIAAVEGQHEKSAELFFGLYKQGASRGFWQGQHLPMLAEVIKSRISQDFIKIYDYELTKQRDRVLAFVES